eukprot:GHVO01004942.1.p1 GENE.GHVO01004942.1~~GHVO01004942.1.p1  ORF type:complete len:140 (-),score=46.18 GHVO01004942.1:62-481(-)
MPPSPPPPVPPYDTLTVDDIIQSLHTHTAIISGYVGPLYSRTMIWDAYVTLMLLLSTITEEVESSKSRTSPPPEIDSVHARGVRGVTTLVLGVWNTLLAAGAVGSENNQTLTRLLCDVPPHKSPGSAHENQPTPPTPPP